MFFREISEYGSFYEDEVCALPGVCHDGVYAVERFFFPGRGRNSIDTPPLIPGVGASEDRRALFSVE